MELVPVKIAPVNATPTRPQTIEASFEVNAFIVPNKFSKVQLPGSTTDDMEELHDMMASHHAKRMLKLHQRYMRAKAKHVQRNLRTQIRQHALAADKHRDLAEHFRKKGLKNPKFKTQPYIPLSTRAKKAAKQAAWDATKFAGKSAFKGAKLAGRGLYKGAKFAGKGAYNVGKDLAEGSYNDTKNAIQGIGHGLHNVGVGAHNIAHHIMRKAVGLWRHLAPHVKHWFTKKRPESPMTQAHFSQPQMMSDNQAIQHHTDQAAFHNEVANQAHQVAANPETPSSKVAKAKNIANENAVLADKHRTAARAIKTKPINVPKKPLAQSTKPAPVSKTPVPPAPAQVKPKSNVKKAVVPVTTPAVAPIAKPKAVKPKAAPVAPVVKPKAAPKKATPVVPAAPAVKPKAAPKKAVVPTAPVPKSKTVIVPPKSKGPALVKGNPKIAKPVPHPSKPETGPEMNVARRTPKPATKAKAPPKAPPAKAAPAKVKVPAKKKPLLKAKIPNV